jgi:hypothetical protein
VPDAAAFKSMFLLKNDAFRKPTPPEKPPPVIAPMAG